MDGAGQAHTGGFVLCSHDGFGVGHFRRHVVLARALREMNPQVPITLVTGLAFTPQWLGALDVEVVHMPSLLKDRRGVYRVAEGDRASALAGRESIFAATVERVRPAVVVADRHPFGIKGELRSGLRRAKAMGAHIVLGLRDVLDDPQRVRAEVAGRRWRGVRTVFDEALVYGAQSFCDHYAEYDIPLPLRYCGWVVEVAHPAPSEPRRLVVTSGGGGDGRGVLELGVAVAEKMPDWRVTIAAGHYVSMPELSQLVAASPARDRVTIVPRAPGCAELFATGAATLQMAGYNATFEAIAAGRRPLLVPRRHPRVEQAIRANRLGERGLADVVESGDVDAVCCLLGAPRTLAPAECDAAGIDLRGAERAARALTESVTARRGTSTCTQPGRP